VIVNAQRTTPDVKVLVLYACVNDEDGPDAVFSLLVMTAVLVPVSHVSYTPATMPLIATTRTRNNQRRVTMFEDDARGVSVEAVVSNGL
jgi:hypothetical protein